MPERRVPGRSFVTRRAIVDIVRPAVSGSYGVLGFAEPNPWKRISAALVGRERGIRVSLQDGIAIDLHLAVAYGLPVAEVARQADSAVRYAVRRALGCEVSRLTVHVRGLRYQPTAPVPPAMPAPPAAPATDALDTTVVGGADPAIPATRPSPNGRGSAEAAEEAPTPGSSA